MFIATECALSSIEAAATVSPLFHFLVPLKRKTTLLLLYYTRRLLFFLFFLSFLVPTLSIRLRNVVPYFFLVLSATSHVCSNADKFVWCIPSKFFLRIYTYNPGFRNVTIVLFLNMLILMHFSLCLFDF